MTIPVLLEAVRSGTLYKLINYGPTQVGASCVTLTTCITWPGVWPAPDLQHGPGGDGGEDAGGAGGGPSCALGGTSEAPTGGPQGAWYSGWKSQKPAGQ